MGEVSAYAAIRLFEDAISKFYMRHSCEDDCGFFICSKLPKDTAIIKNGKKIYILSGFKVDGNILFNPYHKFVDLLDEKFKDTDYKVKFILKHSMDSDKLLIYGEQYIYLYRKDEENE